MRKQHFAWTYLVISIVLTVYGVFSIVYNVIKQKDVPALGLAFAIIGGVMLAVFFALLLVDLFRKKKNPPVPEEPVTEEPEPVSEKPEEEPEAEPAEEIKEEVTVVPPSPAPKRSRPCVEGTVYQRGVLRSRFNGGSGYVKLVGTGPILRVTGIEILDMRSNTYYRIEGNMVQQLGSGPVYEISGNRIRNAFGSYLFEISGSNVNKVFGGYYASFSGGYLQTHDLSAKYEVPSDLNLEQKLAVVALLFA